VSITGFVKNALYSQVMAGVTLKFTSGPNLGKSVISGADGSYTFSALHGAPDGTLQASKAGLEIWSQTFSVKNRTPRLDVMVVPTMSPGQIRIVLSWGGDPRDLDVHLTSPTGCKVWYSNKRCESGTEKVQLDVDDINGFGPETISFNQVVSGKYTLQVHKYSTTSPVALRDSRAVVQVLRKADPNNPIDRAKYGTVDTQLSITTCKASDATSWTSSQNWNGVAVDPAQALWWNVLQYDTSKFLVTTAAGSGCSTVVMQ